MDDLLLIYSSLYIEAMDETKQWTSFLRLVWYKPFQNQADSSQTQ
jgi:hypothetical protein